jgi:hypothetical protein
VKKNITLGVELGELPFDLQPACSFANTHLDCFSQTPELKSFEYPMNWWLVSIGWKHGMA